MKKKDITNDELARMVQRGFDAAATKDDLRDLATKDDLHQVETRLRQEMATKHELRETEEHLLDAVRGIEVKRRDFEALEGQVEELSRRVATLEKTR